MASPQQYPTTSIANLPGDVLSDILIRLLAKQLAQMRCVCKSWNALLSHSSFIKSHLNHSIHNNDEFLVMVSDGCPYTVRHTRSPDLELTNIIKLPVAPESKEIYGYCTFIGSENGLICFSHTSISLGFCDCAVYIWNPSISLVLTLPSGCYSIENHFRFGFDPKTDDYKVVKVTTRLSGSNIPPEVEVYSMRKGSSWDSISQKFPSHIKISGQNDQACVDGHVHWICYTNLLLMSETTVSFDLSAETFREIPLPDSVLYQPLADSKLHHHGPRFNKLGVLAGKLCVMSMGPDGECEVWVMDKYGVAESWEKYCVLSGFGVAIFPYGVTLHNEFVFRDGGPFGVYDPDDRFGLYDPVAAKIKTFKTMCLCITKVVDYVDSLVWVAPTKHEKRASVSILNGRRGDGRWSKLQRAINKATHQIFYILNS